MIYVDDIEHYGYTHLYYKHWCHIWSDTSEGELHEFAEKLGLKRAWFQDVPVGYAKPSDDKTRRFKQHYDLVPTKRALAVRLGAVETTTAEYYRHIFGVSGE